MAIPKLTIVAEPSEADALGYALLAPGTTNGAFTAQLSLRLDLTHKESGLLEALQLEVGFAPPPDELSKKISMSYPTADGLSGVKFLLSPNQLAPWWFGASDNIILQSPLPSTAFVSVLCKGFDPLTIKRPLAPHTMGYRFPAVVTGLGKEEFWQGQSAIHVPGIVGWSLYAYDLVVVGYDFAKGEWSELVPSGDATNPMHYRAWDRTVHAMTDGVVVSVRNDVPDHPATSALPGWAAFDYNDLPNPSKPPISGNHVKIIAANGELVTHAHLQHGSVTKGLNAKVKAGEPLGTVGNSGQSARPSLLVGVSRLANGALLPLSFKDICVLDRDAYDPSTSTGPWFVFGGNALGLPPVNSLIWPDAMLPSLPKGEPPDSHSPVHVRDFLAVDPLSRIISASLYATLTKPRPVSFRQLRPEIAALLRRLDPAGRRSLSTRLKALKKYADEIGKLLEGGK